MAGCFTETYLNLYTGNVTDITVQINEDSDPIDLNTLSAYAVALKNERSGEVQYWSLNNSTGLPIDPAHGAITVLDSAAGVVSLRLASTDGYEDGQYITVWTKVFFSGGESLDAEPETKILKMNASPMEGITI